MGTVLLLKFTQHDELRQLLLATEDAILVEVGVAAKDACAANRKKELAHRFVLG